MKKSKALRLCLILIVDGLAIIQPSMAENPNDAQLAYQLEAELHYHVLMVEDRKICVAIEELQNFMP